MKNKSNKGKPRSQRQASGKSKRANRRSVREFSPDYSYVIKDLKRIITLAVSIIIVLVILSFVLN